MGAAGRQLLRVPGGAAARLVRPRQLDQRLDVARPQLVRGEVGHPLGLQRLRVRVRRRLQATACRTHGQLLQKPASVTAA